MAASLRALASVALPLSIGLLLQGPVAGGSAAPARAESVQPLDWLRQQPLTLFDWGLFNLRRDLDRTALWLADSGLADDKPLTGSQFEWRQSRILAYISFAAPPKRRTRKYCHLVFARAVGQLMRGAPEGDQS